MIAKRINNIYNPYSYAMRIRACMRCGSTNLRARDIDEGLIPGDLLSMSKMVCNDCGYISVPILFDNVREYKVFSEKLKRK